MFILALIFLIILVVAGVGAFWNDPRAPRIGGIASWILFVIIFIALFWSVLNRG